MAPPTSTEVQFSYIACPKTGPCEPGACVLSRRRPWHGARELPAFVLDAPTAAAHVYRPRHPERTALYRVVQDHLETWLARETDSLDAQAPAVRPHVEAAFRDLLSCGLVRFGFVRWRCGDCHRERLVALSCKRRAPCVSCATKRSVLLAARACEKLLPRVPYRQWVRPAETSPLLRRA
jgi:hypothetical protein